MSRKRCAPESRPEPFGTFHPWELSGTSRTADREAGRISPFGGHESLRRSFRRLERLSCRQVMDWATANDFWAYFAVDRPDATDLRDDDDPIVLTFVCRRDPREAYTVRLRRWEFSHPGIERIDGREPFAIEAMDHRDWRDSATRTGLARILAYIRPILRPDPEADWPRLERAMRRQVEGVKADAREQEGGSAR